jgi:hypothetical protein
MVMDPFSQSICLWKEKFDLWRQQNTAFESRIINSMSEKSPTYLLIGSKKVFVISVLVMGLTILSVFFWGLGVHHTFYENSMISTTILSLIFLSFITIGLYNGIKIKDELGKVVDKHPGVNIGDVPDVSTDTPMHHDPPLVEVGDGLEGFVASIFLTILYWILVQFLLVLALWFFSNVLIVAILAFAGMLYWIFFRALRLVFKNSNKSRGNLLQSFKWGLTYTIMYNFWIYGIFFLLEFLKN